MTAAVAECTGPIRHDSDLEQLNTEARRLWQTEPDVDPTRRPILLIELADVDLTLERLSLRASQTKLHDEDLTTLADCRRRLSRLRYQWQPAA